MDQEDREMFRDMSKDVKEGFTGVYRKIDEVQTSIGMLKVDKSVLDERLKTHMADDNRHRNPEQEQRDQEQRARLERREKTKKSDGVWPEWLTVKMILTAAAAIGTLIASIITGMVML